MTQHFYFRVFTLLHDVSGLVYLMDIYTQMCRRIRNDVCTDRSNLENFLTAEIQFQTRQLPAEGVESKLFWHG